jgi:diguanylate cyclase (GGDEF)-like protein
MTKSKSNYTVPHIMNKINKADDLETIIRNENLLACLFASPILFMMSIANFLIRYAGLHEGLGNVLIDSLICVILGLGFEIILRSGLKLNMLVNLVAINYGLWCVFMFIRISKIIGPLVWFGAFLLMLMAMYQIKKNMLLITGSVIIVMGIYNFLTTPIVTYEFGRIHYCFLLLALTAILMISAIVHKSTVNRYKRMMKHIDTLRDQKKEMESLYEEVAASKEKLQFLAFHDSLTQLPNRKMVYQWLDDMIETAKESSGKVYVVYIDIDYFKSINDSLGHDAGDQFIYEVAQRINALIDQKDLIGRIGGDEFALIIPRNVNEDELSAYLNGIKDKFEESSSVHGRKLKSSASLGIAVYPKDGEDTVILMKHADIAMYKSKELGKNKIQYYHPALEAEMLQKFIEEY